MAARGELADTAGDNSDFTGCNTQKAESLAVDGEGHEFTWLCFEKTEV